MAQRIRTVFFWLHLTAGLAAGVVVLIMSVTGVLLTFEKQTIYLGRHPSDYHRPAGGRRSPPD